MNDILAPKGTISEMIGTLKHLRAALTQETRDE
jgi:hypothetical protein